MPLWFAAVAFDVIFVAPAVSQTDIAVPAFADAASETVTEAVLFTLSELVHSAEVIPVITMFVVPADKTGVLNVPVPGVPLVKVTVAVLPVAVVAPERL